MNATQKLPGSWTTDRIIAVLGNALARQLMTSGRVCPVAEKALNSVARSK